MALGVPGSAPTATTSKAISGALMQTWRDRTALERLHEAYYPFYKLAPAVKPIPRREGKVIKFRRYKNLTPVTTTTTEGITPTSVQISAVSFTCTVAQYTNWLPLTDVLKDTAISDVEKEAVEILGDNMWESIDLNLQQLLFTIGGGASVSLGGTITNTAGFRVYGGTAGALLNTGGGNPHFSVVTSSALNPYRIRLVVNDFKRLAVKPFKGGKFKAICHTTVATQLRGNPDLETFMVNNNNSPNWLSKGDTEAGHFMTIEGVDFFESSHVQTASCRTAKQAGTSTVYPTMIFGRGAYGRTEVANAKHAKAAAIIVKHPGPQSTDNPVDLYSTAGWKALLGGRGLNASCGAFFLTRRADSTPI